MQALDIAGLVYGAAYLHVDDTFYSLHRAGAGFKYCAACLLTANTDIKHACNLLRFSNSHTYICTLPHSFEATLYNESLVALFPLNFLLETE